MKKVKSLMKEIDMDNMDNIDELEEQFKDLPKFEGNVAIHLASRRDDNYSSHK
jgi:hypothetical protein